MTTEAERTDTLWTETHRHLREAATHFHQLPEGLHNVYLGLVLSEWSRVSNDPMMGPKMIAMIDTLFSEDAKGHEIHEARPVREALSNFAEEYAGEGGAA